MQNLAQDMKKKILELAKSCTILQNLAQDMRKKKLVKTCASYVVFAIYCKFWKNKISKLAKSCTILQSLAQDMRKKINLQKLAQVMYFLQFILSFEKIKSQNFQNLAQYCKILRKEWEKKN